MTNGLSKNIRKIKTQLDLNKLKVKPNQAGGIKITMTSMHATIAFIESDQSLVLTIIPKESGRFFNSEDLKTIFSEVRKKANKVFNIAQGKIVSKIRNNRVYYQIPILMKEYFYESELFERAIQGQSDEISDFDDASEVEVDRTDADGAMESEGATDLNASGEEESGEAELDTSMLLEEDFSEKSGVKGLTETRLLEELKGFEVSPDSELFKVILNVYKEAIQGLNLGEIVDDMMDAYVNSADPMRKKQLRESMRILHGKITPFGKEADPSKKPAALSFLTQTLFLLKENL